MTSNDAESTPIAADAGIQQIPAQVTVTHAPAVTESRNALLAAIGAEAQLVAEKSTGQASSALVELARAYALVTAGTTAVAAPGLPTGSLPSPSAKGLYNNVIGYHISVTEDPEG
ncbi:MAG: hypothetical protein WCD21_41345 [Streptomyces sp.]